MVVNGLWGQYTQRESRTVTRGEEDEKALDHVQEEGRVTVSEEMH
jgi:hypothetical protein